MRECIEYEPVVSTWGISQMQVADNCINLYVSGFNYQGEVAITSKGNSLMLKSAKECIGFASTPREAIQLLDEYIEANETEYKRLSEFLGI